MGAKLSRRKIAKYVADSIIDGEDGREALRHVAAHLVESGRVREQQLIIRDVEAALAASGTTIADITTAHELNDEQRQRIEQLIASPSVHLREVVDESVLGGVRIATPETQLDATIQRKLNALRAKQL